MRPFTLILTLMIPQLITHAHASWYQTYCSNGEGTTKTSSGHNSNQILLTKKTWNDSSNLLTSSISYDYSQVEVQNEEMKTLEGSHETTCSPDDREGYGFGQWRTVTYRKVKIISRKQELFPQDIVGVTEDRKAVMASMICEENGNSMVACPQPSLTQ